MVQITLQEDTLAILVAGLYSADKNIEPVAIPRSVWMEIAEKLDYFLFDWDYEKISFEDWISHCLFIYPVEAMSEEQVRDLQENTLCWIRENGNVNLLVSMDITPINDGDH